MSANSYIVAAYALTWVVIGGYALVLARRVARAERAADALGQGGAS
jgi:CcmD family protein